MRLQVVWACNSHYWSTVIEGAIEIPQRCLHGGCQDRVHFGVLKTAGESSMVFDRSVEAIAQGRQIADPAAEPVKY
jgi:hypothetical protein